MFFTHAARVAAILVLLTGALNVFVGFGIALGWIGPRDEAMRLLSTEPTTGALIDKGIYRILVGIALGTLAEIGLSLRKRAIKE